MKPREYENSEMELPVVEEPNESFGRRSGNHAIPKGRTTVDEYFNEVRRVLHKKYEDLQG